MINWETTIKHTEQMFDAMHEYGKTVLVGQEYNTKVRQASVSIMEKFHINIINALDLMRKCDENKMHFLSLGLILRGMISDIINYRYLKTIQTDVGGEFFDTELQVLDLDFAKAYQKFLLVENEGAGITAEDIVKDNQIFRERFSDLIEGENLKTISQIRTNEFKESVKLYCELVGIPATTNITSEAGKMDFVVDSNQKQIQITYKLLSQLQHFSSRANIFYKHKAFTDGNALVTIIVMKCCRDVLKNIIADLKQHDPTQQQLDDLFK